jgi:hypothetical protein
LVFVASLAIVREITSYFDDAAEEEEGVVTGKVKSDGTLRNTTLKPGERQLECPISEIQRRTGHRTPASSERQCGTGIPSETGQLAFLVVRVDSCERNEVYYGVTGGS